MLSIIGLNHFFYVVFLIIEYFFIWIVFGMRFDVGAEMAAIHHSVIGTIKLRGSFFLGLHRDFYKNIFNRCRDYVNMVINLSYNNICSIMIS